MDATDPYLKEMLMTGLAQLIVVVCAVALIVMVLRGAS